MPMGVPGKFHIDDKDNTYGGDGTGIHFDGTALENTLIGDMAGAAITTADQNTIMGSQSGQSLTTSSYQTIFGFNNLPAKTSNDDGSGGNYPTFDGTVIVGSQNLTQFGGMGGIVIGVNNYSSLTSTTGSAMYGVTIGYHIGSPIGGNPGLYAGVNALPDVCIGSEILKNSGLPSTLQTPNLSGDILIGKATAHNYQGHGANTNPNIAIGWGALQCSAVGDRTPQSCLAIGTDALLNSGSSSGNTALGHRTLYSIGTGYNNVAVGESSLRTITTHYQNVAVGLHAGRQSPNSLNSVFVGFMAGYLNTVSTSNDVTVGANSGARQSSYSVIIGADAVGVTGGIVSNSVIAGYQAGYATGNRADSVLIGYQAGYSGASVYNIAIGKEVLYAHNSAVNGYNVGIGYRALYGSTTSSFNTAIGNNALANITTGTLNLGLGDSAGYNRTTGNRNVFLGINLISNALAQSDCIFIGHSADNGITANEILSIGSTNLNQFIYGEMATANQRLSFFGMTTGLTDGVKVIGIPNATTVPTTNPTGGGVFYASGGALYWRGSSGTVTLIAPA
ncbi:MAG: hypothetical protein OEZ39_20300 [Gammaproteobacteria bacterium]|nr:hypothetical protein [Gammaproteobacteria bacterium]